MLKSHQPPITVEKQVENLETLGCTVENKEEAIEFLNNVSCGIFKVKMTNKNVCCGFLMYLILYVSCARNKEGRKLQL